jgi:serine/threonine protein kinase
VNSVGVHCSLKSYVLDLSLFDRGPAIVFTQSRSAREVSVKRYSRRSDGFEIVVKSFDSFTGEKMDEILTLLFLLTQLNHRCIAPLIGFVHPTDSTPLKTATLYYGCGSLRDVLNNNPEWLAPTVKCKAIAGIALGMRSAHLLGIIHGSLNPNNILFDDEHCVHLVGFCSNRFQSKRDSEDGSWETDDEKVKHRKRTDVFSFASIVFYILIDDHVLSDSLPFDEEETGSMNDGELPAIPEFVPRFVRGLIEDGWRSEDRKWRHSFEAIVMIMDKNNFECAEGADNNEVIEFVNAVW